MPHELSYARPDPFSGAAIAAFAVGVCSGPASAGAAWLITRTGIDELTALICFGITLLVCVGYCGAIVSSLRVEQPRGHALAKVGLVVSVLWLLSACVCGVYGINLAIEQIR